MMRLAIAVILFVTLGVAPIAAQACRTVTLPNSDNTGGAFTQPVGVTYPVSYINTTAAPIGLEFWFHAFWMGSPQPWQLLYLVYINRPGDIGRRIFWAGNGAPDEYNTGKPVAFPMSTFIQPGETFIVASVNQTGSPAPGYLVVTLRECQ